MGGLERMLGGRDKKREWKNARKPEISEYNKNYYRQNNPRIKAQRQAHSAKVKNALFFSF